MSIQRDHPLVLIADDEFSTTTMLEHLFQREGYIAKSAYDGVEALEDAQNLLPDLILLDINMPKINGLEVLKELRETPATTNIPTILITARGEPDDIVHGLDLGADDYLPKPFHPRELLARAQSKIKAHRLEEALQRRTQDLEALLRASQELNQHLEVEELMELILYLALDLLPGELAIIYRLDEQGEIVNWKIQQKVGTIGIENLDHKNIISEFLQFNSDVLWPDDLPPLVADFDNGMVTSLKHGTDLHGVLLLCSHQPFDSSHYRLFNGIAIQATLALRNTELYRIQASYALHLEDMVAERTAALESTHQMLIQAEKLASVGRLAASIAHEINNPLLPISINLEHMLEDARENIAITPGDIEKTQESVERISRIVKQLLQFTGKQNIDESYVEHLNIIEIIEDVIDLNRKYFEHREVVVETFLQPVSPIFGSRDQLGQVFMNLALNAGAAIQEEGNLQIRTQQEGNQVVITFTDDGSGISPDLINNIFEPFVSTKDEGTGLGLFISYGIVENHQGTIEVQSVVDKGTTFTVRLPVSDSPPDNE
jgi:signal transduction histidine kinase/DNA-binding response OmpR family regulator